jgi:hypothetical protein
MLRRHHHRRGRRSSGLHRLRRLRRMCQHRLRRAWQRRLRRAWQRHLRRVWQRHRHGRLRRHRPGRPQRRSARRISLSAKVAKSGAPVVASRGAKIHERGQRLRCAPTTHVVCPNHRGGASFWQRQEFACCSPMAVSRRKPRAAKPENVLSSDASLKRLLVGNARCGGHRAPA